ncbi:related to paxillin [Ceraceosorus bombacis]|uniref:Related to paxillin n=1 Tax=Ceraceosorus bombacis TaxID=401625 RepID=A0A0P1BMR4_9BASI|nr:related to paxillin [Ceraceosorus bombacis]
MSRVPSRATSPAPSAAQPSSSSDLSSAWHAYAPPLPPPSPSSASRPRSRASSLIPSNRSQSLEFDTATRGGTLPSDTFSPEPDRPVSPQPPSSHAGALKSRNDARPRPVSSQGFHPSWQPVAPHPPHGYGAQSHQPLAASQVQSGMQYDRPRTGSGPPSEQGLQYHQQASHQHERSSSRIRYDSSPASPGVSAAQPTFGQATQQQPTYVPAVNFPNTYGAPMSHMTDAYGHTAGYVHPGSVQPGLPSSISPSDSRPLPQPTPGAPAPARSPSLPAQGPFQGAQALSSAPSVRRGLPQPPPGAAPAPPPPRVASGAALPHLMEGFSNVQISPGDSAYAQPVPKRSQGDQSGMEPPIADQPARPASRGPRDDIRAGRERRLSSHGATTAEPFRPDLANPSSHASSPQHHHQTQLATAVNVPTIFSPPPDEPLEHVAFYEHEGKPFCHFDYHELFSRRCFHCRTPIVDERFITISDPELVGSAGANGSAKGGATERSYHDLHFFCANCGDPFIDPKAAGSAAGADPQNLSFDENGNLRAGAREFVVWKGYPYCEKCHIQLHKPRCKGCRQPIVEGDVITALKAKWHPHCFVCEGCKRPFESPNFFIRGNKAYDEDCYKVMLRNEL